MTGLCFTGTELLRVHSVFISITVTTDDHKVSTQYCLGIQPVDKLLGAAKNIPS